VTVRIFWSCPSSLSSCQRSAARRWWTILERTGFEVLAPARAADPSAILYNIRSAMQAVDGAVILALRQLRVDEGSWRPDTTAEAEPARWWPSPWTQVEAGMAIMRSIPILIVREDGVTGGPLDPLLSVEPIHGARLDATRDDSDVRAWANEVISPPDQYMVEGDTGTQTRSSARTNEPTPCDAMAAGNWREGPSVTPSIEGASVERS
jgi:hypothetical protein